MSSSILDNNNWSTLKSEATGVINISELHEGSRAKNTVLTKFTLESDTDQFKQLDFGYSDRVQVYCNGQILYSGNNGYRSRDYRFLGSIGYFDTVYLPLKRGNNEIIMTLSESFGGWGIQAKLGDMNGIKFQ